MAAKGGEGLGGGAAFVFGEGLLGVGDELVPESIETDFEVSGFKDAFAGVGAEFAQGL